MLNNSWYDDWERCDTYGEQWFNIAAAIQRNLVDSLHGEQIEMYKRFAMANDLMWENTDIPARSDVRSNLQDELISTLNEEQLEFLEKYRQASGNADLWFYQAIDDDVPIPFPKLPPTEVIE